MSFYVVPSHSVPRAHGRLHHLSGGKTGSTPWSTGLVRHTVSIVRRRTWLPVASKPNPLFVFDKSELADVVVPNKLPDHKDTNKLETNNKAMKSEVEKNEEALRQYTSMLAASLWMAKARTAASGEASSSSGSSSAQTPTSKASGVVNLKEQKQNNQAPVVDQTFVDDSTETIHSEADRLLALNRPGCQVGVYLVRSDGHSCSRQAVVDGVFRLSHPSTQQLLINWQEAPRSVFVLKKLGTNLLGQALEVIVLVIKEGGRVLVEPSVLLEIRDAVAAGQVTAAILESITVFGPSSQVDLIMCLGGDGVILHASSLFQGPCPPLLGFNLGSMGFLAPHTFTGMKKTVAEAMMLSSITDDEKYKRNLSSCEGVPITLRMRLHAEIWTKDKPKENCQGYHILNELVIDRGPSSFLSMIECYELTLNNELRLLTKVQADGLIVSTATGSTAYSVSAGGSMVHPSVPAILVTPICPHTLSFRPVVLPDSARILLRVSEDARSTAWVCFDGKSRQEVKRGDGVLIKMSEFPVPTINWGDQMSEFVGSLVRCLNWNDREEQKPLTESSPLGHIYQKTKS